MVFFSFILLSVHILPALFHKACFAIYNVCYSFDYRFLDWLWLDLVWLIIIWFEFWYLFYCWNTNDISVRFGYILCDMIGKLVGYVDYIFYVKTNSYIIYFMLKFRMDNNSSCYDMNCVSMVTNVLFDWDYRDGLIISNLPICVYN